MPYFIGMLFVWQIMLDIFGIDVGLAPGLSLKNLVVYAGLATLLVRGLLTETLRFEIRELHTACLLLLLYATLTWLVASYVIRYENYNVLQNGILLKTIQLDYYAMFLVSFLAIRNLSEADLAMRLVTLASSLPQILTLTEVAGITSLGVSPVRDDGRVDGALGEANMYAAYIAFFLPTYIVRAVDDRRVWRLAWLGSIVLAVVVMLLTVSRGGILGLMVGAVISAVMFRRQIPVGRILTIGAIGLSLAIVALFALNTGFRSLVMDRMLAESTQADIGIATSGRTDFWVDALKVMAAQPITFLTGYGWRVYWSLPFQYSPHNSYLNYWFNLGLPGLLLFSYPFVLMVRRAAQAARQASTQARNLMIGFVFGVVSMCVAVFFVELYYPWFYIWFYMGLVMRTTVLLQTGSQPAPLPARRSENPRRSGSDRYGWRSRSAPTAARKA
jgi:O-antigen ligase